MIINDKKKKVKDVNQADTFLIGEGMKRNWLKSGTCKNFKKIQIKKRSSDLPARVVWLIKIICGRVYSLEGQNDIQNLNQILVTPE